MTTIESSLASHPCCLYHKATELSRPLPSTHYICGSKATYQTFEKLNMNRNQFAHNGPVSCSKSQDVKLYAMPSVSIGPPTSSEVVELENPSSYLFRSEIGGLVKVLVGKTNIGYAVYIEVSSFEIHSSKSDLVLSWGTSRTPMEFSTLASDAKPRITETPFVKKNVGRFAIDIEFVGEGTPFYLSFLLKSAADSDPYTTEIRSHRKTRFCVPVGFGSGRPTPLGLSFPGDGSIYFAFTSKSAESVALCLYDERSTQNPALEIELDPYVNHSDNIWHASIKSSSTFMSYGYRCNRGEVLLDPYAEVIDSSLSNNNRSDVPLKHLGKICKQPVFDWSDDIRPNLALENLVVYRLNVMRFTVEKSSKLPSNVAGTFSGLSKKLQHFKDLGVNAILLEPILLFDETREPYYPRHFFSPMNQFGPYDGDSVSAINSMKEMVKSFHANGIEVILEVVFTHTAETGALQGIDDSFYYYQSGDSGTRSDLNCNHPLVQQMIIDSLRYWVAEFRVDGFCFINASSLLRGFHGETLSRPPLIETIAFDPILMKTKIIADCWDPREMVSKEVHFPNWKRWSEMNTKFCTDIRTFLKGDGGLSNLATRLCGSGDIFLHGRGPAFSFNFVSRNSGLPLVDLVSFSSNEELASEFSWNCGEEGPTSKTSVLEKRLKQIRNFLFILFISLGVPVLNMGDECGLSSGGSVAYGDRKPFDWKALKTGFATQMTQFISFLSSLRVRRSDLLQRRNFLKVENINWHGSDYQSSPGWDDPSNKFLAMTLIGDEVEDSNEVNTESLDTKGHLFIAFNAADHSERVILPPPASGMAWFRLVDTALPYPGFFSEDGEIVLEQIADLVVYQVMSHSCSLFEARSLSD